MFHFLPVTNQVPFFLSFIEHKGSARPTIFAKSIEKLHSALFIEPNPVIPKWALYKMGMMKSPFLRLPMVLPELASQKSIEALLHEYALISE